jgi:hyperosmotically inducible periplasmic protein
MKVLLGLIVGVLIGFVAFWYLSERDRDVRVRESGVEAPAPRDRLDTEGIKDELSRTGRVIREKAGEAGEAIGEFVDNASTTAAVKAKLLQDSGTSGLAIDVDTTDGVVTLSGKVSSHAELDRAMDLALETKGVHKVISALQVEAPEPNR